MSFTRTTKSARTGWRKTFQRSSRKLFSSVSESRTNSRNFGSKTFLFSEGDDKDEADEKKRQKRGGKGLVKAKKKLEVEKAVRLSRAPRGKKKSVTVVNGLSTFGIDLKDASKYFSNKFACGCSVTGDDELVIQGDVKDDLFDILPEKWPDVS